MSKQVLVCSVILLALSVSSWGLVYNAEEFTSQGSFCTPLIPDPSLNMTWLRSVEYWHMSMWSKSTLMKVMQKSVTSEEFGNITESELKKSCFMLSRFQDPPANVELYGLGRKLSDYQTSLPLFRDGVIIWLKDGVYGASSYVVLTDNKSYILAMDELSDGVRGYWLGTVSDAISPTEWDKIYGQIASFHFKRDSTYPLESSCADDEYITQLKLRKN